MFVINAAEDVTHSDRKLAEHGEGRGAVGGRAEIVVFRVSRVGKRCPVLKFFVCVQELNGDETIRFLECNWASCKLTG